MIITINDKEYELKTTLGTVKKMETKLNTGFMKMAEKFDSLHISELQKLILCGANKQDENKLKEALDECGVEEFYIIVSKFFAKIQNPRLTDEELEKIVKENQEALETEKK